MEIAKEAMLDLNQGSQSTKSSALISLIVKWAPGWPDWANFRLLGDCLLWIGFLKVTEAAELFGLLITKVKFMFKSWQKTGWATFWAISFHQHIWSPWWGHTVVKIEKFDCYVIIV
jgi:hypothetical protein